MANSGKQRSKYIPKDALNSTVREKMGMTLAQLGSIFGHSRAYMSMAESKKRNLNATTNTFLAKMFLQFLELENGTQATYRSLETRLFLNDLYKQQLPQMAASEKACRSKMKELTLELKKMKDTARDAENSIIVFTSTIRKIKEKELQTDKEARMITGLELFKQQAYQRLLTCWEPEQARLQARIEAIAGEARALRRFRLQIIRLHEPTV